MSATKISDLLPIPDGAKTPHPYQIFGLEGGEQDGAKIKAAVQETYRRLREAKADTDPDLWRTAAKLVEKARSILSDPQKRAALDARFGVIGFDETTDIDASSSPDPLAGILPSSDPLASDPLRAVVPLGDPMAVAVPSRPTAGMAPMGIAPTAPDPMTRPTGAAIPQTTAVEETPIASATPTTAAVVKHPVVLKPKKSSKRRRKSWLGTAMFVLFMIGMFAIIGSLLYFMVHGPGHLSVTSKDGQISISTNPRDNAVPLGNPRSLPTAASRGRNDPVLGSVPRSSSRPGGSLANANPMANPNAMPPGEMTNPSPPMQTPQQAPPTETPPTETPTVTPSTDTPVPETPEPGPTTQTPPETNPQPPGSETMLPVQPGEQETPAQEMTDEMIAAANKAIANVEKLIQKTDWQQMKSAAEKVTEMTLTNEQRVYADALYNLADLATFYRGGIIKGIGTLQTASTFELTEGMTVLVVEASADGLTIRRGARNHTYTLDDMPFVVTARLCAFALSPDKPETIAARSCFQSIALKSNAEYRKDAISWLEFVNDDVEGIDTKEVAKAIKKLFAD